jgi:type I restriction enzyme, S subunit
MNEQPPKTLNDACEFIVDCLHATAPIQADGYALIRTPNIGKGRLDLTDVQRVSEDTYQTWTKRATPEPGDLILAREAPAGNVALVGDGEKVCLGQRTVHLRPDKTMVDSSYLCYFLLAPRQQGELLAGETGATAKHVNMKDIRKLPLTGLPNLLDQRSIVSFLTPLDDLFENNRRRIDLLNDAAKHLYEDWFVRFRFPGHEHAAIIEGVPAGWVRVPLGERVVLNYGKALKAEDRNEGPIPVYGSSGIVGFHGKALATAPGIVVGRKGNVGSVFWCSKDYWPIDTVYFIDDEISNLWLYCALQQVNFTSTDAAVPGLNRNLAYSRPLLVAEERIIRNFLEIVGPMHEQIAKLNEINDRLMITRDLLLPRLMSGEIAVR